MLLGNSLRQTVHTHRASVHQAAKFVAALLRVARVTVGLTESNGQPTVGFMTHLTCKLTAKNWDQLWNPMLGNRVWATFTFFQRSTNTHTHTHPFNGPLSRTTRVSRYQKGKTNLDFTEARRQ